MGQLFIRPSVNDHHVVADLLAPSPVPTLRRLRPPISHLVVDAHVALQRPSFARSAHDAGIPIIVDPMTPFLQSVVDPDERWVQLPFGVSAAVDVAGIDVPQLVESVVRSQLDLGATQVVAPYLYAKDPSDPAFEISLQLLAETRRFLDRERLQLPLVAVACVQLQAFSRPAHLDAGVRRFARACESLGVANIGLLLSPLGGHKDSYGKLVSMARIVSTVSVSSVPVTAWRQGTYGPAMVAMGLDGYETGIGMSEQGNVPRLQSARKPRDGREQSGGTSAGVFIEPIGRSVPLRVGKALLGSIEMRSHIICDDASCCSGHEAMVENRRQHAVKTRARTLAELSQLPRMEWRLSQIERHAAKAATLAGQANRVLKDLGVAEQIGTTNLTALARLTGELREAASSDRSA